MDDPTLNIRLNMRLRKTEIEKKIKKTLLKSRFFFKNVLDIHFIKKPPISPPPGSYTEPNLCQPDRLFLVFSDTTRNERHHKSN